MMGQGNKHQGADPSPHHRRQVHPDTPWAWVNLVDQNHTDCTDLVHLATEVAEHVLPVVHLC